jgi:MerR family transcriptional regulator/heat shock protein HspR
MPKRPPRSTGNKGTHQPKYSITTVAELTGVPPQQLRRLEKAAIVKPARSAGGTRRYSDTDVAQVARARDLADAGVNQAGIERILALEDALQAAEERTATAEAAVERYRQALGEARTEEPIATEEGREGE